MASGAVCGAAPCPAGITGPAATVVLVESAERASTLAATLARDYDIVECIDIDDAMRTASSRDVDLILVDAAADDTKAAERAMSIRGAFVEHVPIVVFDAAHGDDARASITLLGANPACGRRWRVDEIAPWIAGAIADSRRARARTTTRRPADAALGELRSEMDEMLASHVARQTAAAIVHELNQPLSAIAAYTETAARLVKAGNPEPDRLLRALQGNERQVQRAGDVVRELIAFLHRGDTAPESVDMNEAVRRALLVVESSGLRDFRTVVDVASGLKPVRANRLHVEKVLANLLHNSVEAMRAAGVQTQTITIVIRASGDDRGAQVSVRDNGPGIDEATAQRAFDPSFTTKARGVGMGLAISRALIEAHGGMLWLDRDGGPGATFHFTLPFAE